VVSDSVASQSTLEESDSKIEAHRTPVQFCDPSKEVAPFGVRDRVDIKSHGREAPNS
jgi:hypothetical protein